MTTERYNGWANRDTWLTVLWINNDYDLYNTIRAHKEDVLSMNRTELLNFVYAYGHVTDKIVRKNVNIQEVKEAIEEL